jgi:uncharacterized protein with GYD domain
MPIYILLSSLSTQGVQTLKSNPDRLREVNHDVEELGARVLHQWATLGEFDFISVVEAPDTATVARVSVALGARGSTQIETLPALTIDEFIETLSLRLSRKHAGSAHGRSMGTHEDAAMSPPSAAGRHDRGLRESLVGTMCGDEAARRVAHVG